MFVRDGHKVAPKQALGSRLKHFDMLPGRCVLPIFELGRDQACCRGTVATGDRGERLIEGLRCVQRTSRQRWQSSGVGALRYELQPAGAEYWLSGYAQHLSAEGARPGIHAQCQANFIYPGQQGDGEGFVSPSSNGCSLAVP